MTALQMTISFVLMAIILMDLAIVRRQTAAAAAAVPIVS
jgi:hypothetical protein